MTDFRNFTASLVASESVHVVVFLDRYGIFVEEAWFSRCYSGDMRDHSGSDSYQMMIEDGNLECRRRHGPASARPSSVAFYPGR